MQFEEMGWDIFLRKKLGKLLCSSVLIGGGGGDVVVATLLIGLKGMLISYFVQIEMYLAAEIIIIYQDFKSAFFFLRQLD